jgi:hypothetical protein
MVIIFGVILYSTQSSQTFVLGNTTITLKGLGLGVALVATAAIMARTIIAMRKNDDYSLRSARLLSMYRKLARTFSTSALIWLAVSLLAVLVVFKSNPEVSKIITLIAILVVAVDVYRRREGKAGTLPGRPKYY